MLDALKKIWQFAGKEKGNLNKSIALGFVFAVFNMFQISALYFVIRGSVHAQAGKGYDGSVVYTALIFLVLSIAGRTLVNYFAQLQQTHAGYFMVADKRSSIGNKLKTVPMGYFTQNTIGSITGITTTVLDEVETTAPMVLVNMLSGFLNATVFTAAILIFEWRTGLIVVLGTLIYLFITSLMEKKSRTLAPKRQEAQTRLVEAVLEQLQGMHIVKAFNVTGRGDKKVRSALEHSCNANLNIERAFTPYTILQGLVLRLSGLAMIFCSLLFYFNRSMELIDALMLIIVSFMVFAQIESAGSALSILRVVSSSIDEANKTDSMPQMENSGTAPAPETHDIRFEHVDFAYGERQILKDICVSFPEKTMTAIVGPNGSGKTTMCNLIARFWDIERGRILIGGKNIKEYGLETLMEQISMVFQNVYLFEDTIENNIKFGKPEAGREEVIEAAKKAGCHEFIEALPAGYDTIIGEGGASLSGGEKQRLSIARALLKNAPVIIFDEATANIDPENEASLQKAIEELTKDKTVIMIAHRLKTVRNADNIIVLDNGCIVQQGTHTELIQEEGIYKNFIRLRQESAHWKLVKN
ncbi:ABC transporter ATP-binding protein [Treponema sp. OMZ 840]|uniref:ABC transporter ATP-binding protein n=1 Tax=Treponema sp. OMZ 840 TaxID=244313 RepID=UPI003D8B007D